MSKTDLSSSKLTPYIFLIYRLKKKKKKGRSLRFYTYDNSNQNWTNNANSKPKIGKKEWMGWMIKKKYPAKKPELK